VGVDALRLKGKRVAVLVEDGFEDLEFWVPVMRLREEGADVIIAGLEGGKTYTGKTALKASADVTIDSLNASELDALVVPGGWAPDKLRRYKRVKELLVEMNSQDKIIALICHGGLVGISAGIVRGVKATGSEGIRDDLVNAGAIWTDEAAFRDKNFVWGRVVKDIPDFCRELVKAVETI